MSGGWLSPQGQLAAQIIDRMDESRIECYGGYPSAAVIRGRDIIIASVDHDDRPTLTVQTVAAFVRENAEWLDDEDLP